MAKLVIAEPESGISIVEEVNIESLAYNLKVQKFEGSVE